MCEVCRKTGNVAGSTRLVYLPMYLEVWGGFDFDSVLYEFISRSGVYAGWESGIELECESLGSFWCAGGKT